MTATLALRQNAPEPAPVSELAQRELDFLMRQIQSDLEKRRSNYSELNEYQELKTSEHVRKA